MKQFVIQVLELAIMSKLNVSVREKFKVKIKSLAEESRIIRRHVKALGKEFKRAKEPEAGRWWGSKRCDIAEAQGSLNWHRIDKVRFESRHALLAYAYVRGVPYCVVEKQCDTEPSPSDVARIVRSLSWRSADDVKEWMARPKAEAA